MRNFEKNKKKIRSTFFFLQFTACAEHFTVNPSKNQGPPNVSGASLFESHAKRRPLDVLVSLNENAFFYSEKARTPPISEISAIFARVLFHL